MYFAYNSCCCCFSDKPLVQDNNNNIVPQPSPSSSLTNSATITPPREEEAIQPEEITIKSPNNIEFNPPKSAENLSTAMAHEIPGAGRANGSRELIEKEDKNPSTSPKRKS
jgi:hypothetical protein